jgi:hypothetical protein
MVKAIKAIDTRYAGHLFRSRLEARWAVFFDQIGLRWEYEPEGYVISDGTRYLPDFRTTARSGARRWLEVKPAHITQDPKFTAFARAAINSIYEDDYSGEIDCWPALVSGTPLEWLQSGKTLCPRCGGPMDNYDYGTETFLCESCDNETEFGGGNPTYANGIAGICWKPHKGWVVLDSRQAARWQKLLINSAMHAQKARFEHGANPF